MHRSHQIERINASTSAGVTGRGFAFAPGRPATASATSRRRVLGDAEIAQALEAAEPRELLDARGRIIRAQRRAEPRDRLARDRLVEPQRRRQRQRVQRAVRRAVAAAERLGERVPEREHRAAEGGSGMTGAAEELLARVRVVGLLDHPRQPCADQLRAREGIGVALGRPLADVERLGAVRERVQRRADGLGTGSSSVSFGS